MPILQRIEISNFLNSGRHVPWRPDWPHQIFELHGENAALNIPNGKGKSTMFLAILAMLLHDKVLRSLQQRFFAPKSSGHYTHIRIQVQIPIPGANDDLVTISGGEISGKPMVFGMYGYSGENERFELYAYHGCFEDCPVASVHNLHHTLIADDAFLGQLKGCPGLFPGNAKERTKRAWLAFVDDFFDMSSIKQQFVYQQLKGAEGGHGYFDVTPPAGMNYSAAVFYARLAPELLTEVMGDLGEEGEHGIEDTIHEKVSRVIAAKHETARKAEELRRAGNTLRELQGLLESSADLSAAKQKYDQHLEAFSVELAVLKDVLTDNPIPGIPRMPPAEVPEIAKQMVIQGENWFLPDKVMAEFSNEPASEVNRRAHDRNGIALTQANRSQLIDFPCHIKVRDTRGKPNQLYSRDSALALLRLTSNYTRDWSREKAVDAVTRAFDWVEAQADTNPARALSHETTRRLKEAQDEFDRLTKLYKEFQDEKEGLLTEQSRIGEQQAEYRRMGESSLFTADELAIPAETGRQVTRQFEEVSTALENHTRRMARLEGIHRDWQAYVAEYGSSDKPGERADQLRQTEQTAKKNLELLKGNLKHVRSQSAGLETNEKKTERQKEQAQGRLDRFVESLPALQRFRALFGGISPTGLAVQVVRDQDAAKTRMGVVDGELKRIEPFVAALAAFRAANGEVEPAIWLKERSAQWDQLGSEINSLKDELKEAKIKRAALDKAVIVGGKVTREAAEIAGGTFRPVHEVVMGMQLALDRQERVLTLLSALLHAPVYENVNDAAEAAQRLAQSEVEAPVFVRDELEAFCRSGQIEMGDGIAHAWLVGIHTRQVDCLLDPTLVEREKDLADQRIGQLDGKLGGLELERARFDPESPDANMARQAQEAVSHAHKEQQEALISERAELQEKLPELQKRANATDDIKQVERHLKEFGETTEADLRTVLAQAQLEYEQAAESRAANKYQLETLEAQQEELQQLWANATQAANNVELLRRIQAYIDHPEDSPVFMASAPDITNALTEEKSEADKRTRFRFDLAESFVRAGRNRPKEIEERLTTLRDEQDEIQIRQLPKLTEQKDALFKREQELGGQAGEIDRFIVELLRKYRDFSVERDDVVSVNREQIEWHPLGGFAPSLREASSLEEQVRLMLDIVNDTEMEEASELRQKMKEARKDYQTAKTALSMLVDKVLSVGDLDISEHVRMELQRAKEQPAIIKQLHEVASDNFSKNDAANKIASEHLDHEWMAVGSWLEKFTLRLPDNLKTMKTIFGPKTVKLSEDQEELVSAGFVIEASLVEQKDIRTVLDDVVRLVEKFEETKKAMANVASSLRDSAIRSLREEIRTTFYQKVIIDPRIKVYMPSISKRPLPLEKNMVSTGQGVAMTLLWIVKMADFITERELRRQTTSRAQLRHLHPTQFALMDGAFSSLSNKGLIKDALDSIKGTRGRFQLIISGHDENYQNNFEYFPVLIEAREINGQFMYADSKTRRVYQPEEVGSHYGAMGTMNMRVSPLAETQVEH